MTSTLASLRSQVAELARRTRPAPTVPRSETMTTSELRHAIYETLAKVGITAPNDLRDLLI
jgi:hypothetical protein